MVKIRPEPRRALLKLEQTIIYPKNLKKITVQAIYDAWSHWNRVLLPLVKQEIPVYKGPPTDPRRKPGFVRSKLGLVKVQGIYGLHYYSIGVPGAEKYGSPEWHAFSAIMDMEGKTATAVRIILPKRKRVLYFPVGREKIIKKEYAVRGLVRDKKTGKLRIAQRGPPSWLAVKRVMQYPFRRKPTYPIRKVLSSSEAWKMLSRLLTAYGVKYLSIRRGRPKKVVKYRALRG